MRRLTWILCILFIALVPAYAQEEQDDGLPLAYLVHDELPTVSFSHVWADNRYDSHYAGFLPGEFGFREGVSWESAGFVPFGVDFAIGDYALSPDRTQLAFSAYDPTDVTGSDGNTYRGFDYGLFIYNFVESISDQRNLTRIDISHPVDVIWSPEGDSLLLPAVGIEGLPTPFYSGEEDTLIYDLTDQTFYTLQAGDPPLFYVDGYDVEFDVEGKTFYFSARPPYVWLPDERVLFQSGGRDCADDCQTWNDLYIADRDGSNLQRLTTLADEESLPPDLFIRDAVWSPVDERIYFELYGTDSYNFSAIYSAGLDGNLREEFTASRSVNYLRVTPNEAQDANYVTIDRGVLGWSILRLGGSPDTVETLYEGSPDETSSSVDAFSDDGRYAAVNMGEVTRIIDLENHRVNATIQTGWVCGLRWLDDDHVVYQSVTSQLASAPECPDETNGIWRGNVTNGGVIDLTERWTKPLRLLLPQ
jgi:hypothetical protein